MANDKVTLKLFHGRNHPDEQPPDWGFDGPTLGPLEGVTLTYGWAALHPTSDEMIELRREGYLFVYKKCFYGGVTIAAADAEPATEQVNARFTRGRYNPGSKARHTPVVVPRQLLKAYRERVEVFVDSVRHLAGDKAAESVKQALEDVVPDRISPRA